MENTENTNINVDENGVGANAQEETQVKTYTEEEVLKLIQSEADKRVNQALGKQKKEYEKKISLTVPTAKSAVDFHHQVIAPVGHTTTKKAPDFKFGSFCFFVAVLFRSQGFNRVFLGGD